jgi:hypothetical protein
MRFSRVSELPHKTSGGSHSGSVLPRVGITQKDHATGKDSVPNRKGPRKYTDNDAVLSNDMAESVHGQHSDLFHKTTKEVGCCTELSLDMSDMLWGDIGSESNGFTGSRSVGCQTVDPENFDELYGMGVIKYPSTIKLRSTKLRHAEKRLPTCEMEKQRDRAPSPDSNICSAAGNRLKPDGSDDPDIQKLTLYEHKEAVHKQQEVVNMLSCCQ